MVSNNSQTIAIQHTDGPMLVLAGPGSGKTRVITHRVISLIKRGVLPENILVITFTKAAAKEMKSRFEALLDQKDRPSGPDHRDGPSGPTFGTFHAIFYSILKQAYHLSPDNISKDEDRYAIIKSIIRDMHLDYDDESEFIANLLSEIAVVKSEMIRKNQGYKSKTCDTENFFEVYDRYHMALKQKRLLDFEDMLVYTYELFEKRADILAAWQNRFRYILIDEFQDINKIQYDVIRMLAKPRNNLFIVGDDDQSIYGFRGSRPEIMLNFKNDYPNARMVTLDVNYRCTPQVVKAAGDVIKWNHKRFPKNITPNKEDGAPVVIRRCKDFIDEYTEVTSLIRRMASDGVSYSDIAVLYRTAGGIGSLVRKLMEYNIPFRINDMLPNVFEHFIAKDLFAYIKLANGIGNRNDFLMIANKPKRYIGREFLNSTEIDFDELCEYYAEDKPWMVDRLRQFESDLKVISKLNPYAAITYIRKSIGYDSYLTEYALTHRIDVDDLFDIVNEIMDSAREYNTYFEWEQGIKDYQKKIIKSVREEGDRVTLTTMHSSKGLEFDTVFVVDVNEEVCPHKKAILDSEIEEERRMLYVAMTRAKKMLYIYGVMERFNKHVKPSRFLVEAGLVEKTKIPESNTVSINSGKKTEYNFAKPSKHLFKEKDYRD